MSIIIYTLESVYLRFFLDSTQSDGTVSMCVRNINGGERNLTAPSQYCLSSELRLKDKKTKSQKDKKTKRQKDKKTKRQKDQTFMNITETPISQF